MYNYCSRLTWKLICLIIMYKEQPFANSRTIVECDLSFIVLCNLLITRIFCILIFLHLYILLAQMILIFKHAAVRASLNLDAICRCYSTQSISGKRDNILL